MGEKPGSAKKLFLQWSPTPCPGQGKNSVRLPEGRDRRNCHGPFRENSVIPSPWGLEALTGRGRSRKKINEKGRRLADAEGQGGGSAWKESYEGDHYISARKVLKNGFR